MNEISAKEIFFSPWEVVAKLPYTQLSKQHPLLAEAIERIIAIAFGILFDASLVFYHSLAVAATLFCMGARTIRIIPNLGIVANLIPKNMNHKTLRIHIVKTFMFGVLAIPFTSALGSLWSPSTMLEVHVEKKLIPNYPVIIKKANEIANRFIENSHSSDRNCQEIEALCVTYTINAAKLKEQETSVLAETLFKQINETYKSIHDKLRCFSKPIDITLLTRNKDFLDSKRFIQLDQLAHEISAKILILKVRAETAFESAEKVRRDALGFISSKKKQEESQLIQQEKLEEERRQQEEKEKKIFSQLSTSSLGTSEIQEPITIE